MLLGNSALMRQIRGTITKLGQTGASVLISGESGTGKELAARLIHARSQRASGPFVAVNCGAIPHELMESEFFGHKRGSFTGATDDKQGLFHAAAGGTLFLDEVAELPSSMQVKLLRALQEKAVRPVGDTRERPVDVRVVSASHKNLEHLVEQRAFRQDLFYRINTIILDVPPLRARREDIPLLARHFAAEFASAGGPPITLTDECLDTLQRMDLPGNVRELRGLVERGIALAMPGHVVEACHVQADGRATPVEWQDDLGVELPPLIRPLRDRVEEVQCTAIREALAHFEGNRTQSARALGLSRPGLTKMMRRLGLDDL